MSRYILDTMVVVLKLEKRRLPEQVNSIFSGAEKENEKFFIPSIVFAEIAYLSEKDRIEISLKDVKDYLSMDKIEEYELTIDVIEESFQIDDIPELHDRLIAGTAKKVDVPVITNDPEMEKSKHVDTIWN